MISTLSPMLTVAAPLQPENTEDDKLTSAVLQFAAL